MKAVVVEASPKREGNSVTLAREFIRGLMVNREAGVSELYLEDLDIQFYGSCWSCLKRGEPGCVIEDDMTWIYPKLYEADVLVFATPVYWWDINAQMKKFIDRFEGLLDGNGPNNLSGKKLVLVITYNMEDPDGVYLAIQMFRSIAGWAGLDLVVLKYNGSQRHVSESPEALAEAYNLGADLSTYKRLPLLIQCPVEGCKGRFGTVEALAKHLASGAGLDHRGWRSENGFKDLGFRTDELWMGILERLR